MSSSPAYASPALHPSAARKRSWLLRICVALALLLNLQLPRGVADSSLDSSWSQVLLHALLQHVQWGPQLSFTYGPLGFVTPYQDYVADGFMMFALARCILAVLFATLTWYVLRRLALYRLAIFAAGMFTVGAWIAGDATWLLAYAWSIVALSQLLESTPRPRGFLLQLVLISLLPALLPLVKTTLVIPWAVWLLTGTLMCMSARRFRAALLHFVVGVVAPLLGWLACGQQAAHLGNYLLISLDVATGYADAMQLAPRHIVDFAVPVAALAGMAMIGTYVFLRRYAVMAWLVAVMFATVLICAFRLGCTRADWLHLQIFSTTSLLLLAAIPMTHVAESNHRWLRRAAWMAGLCCLSALMVIGAFSMSGNRVVRTWSGALTISKVAHLLGAVVNPSGTNRVNRAQADSIGKTTDLPAIRQQIGAEPVDVFSYEQGAAYSNHLNLVFRPVFQSYSAYTPTLMERNDAFYRSPTAPTWIIFKLQTVDQRLPSEDDAAVFSRVAASYQPVLIEKGYLLLKWQAEADESCKIVGRSSKTLAIGDWLQLHSISGERLDVRFQLELSTMGKLKAALLRSPIPAIEVRADDNSIHRYRLIRAAAAHGFMLSPLLNTTDEYLDWRNGRQTRRAMAVRILPWNPDAADDFSHDTVVSTSTSRCVRSTSTKSSTQSL